MNLSVESIPSHIVSSFSEDIENVTLYHFQDGNTVRFYPEGRIELLFQLDGDFLHRTPSDSDWILRPSGFVGGLHLQAYHVRSIKKAGSCLGVSFKPGAAARYLPLRLDSIKNTVLSTCRIWGAAGSALTDNVLRSDCLHKQLDVIFDFLSSQRCHSMQDLRLLCNSIQDKRGSLTVGQMANIASYSPVQLRRLFQREVGVSPKKFSQIVRVREARHHLNSSHHAGSLTDLAFSLGYYDQAHFVREFRAITGMTPRQYNCTAEP